MKTKPLGIRFATVVLIIAIFGGYSVSVAVADTNEKNIISALIADMGEHSKEMAAKEKKERSIRRAAVSAALVPNQQERTDELVLGIQETIRREEEAERKRLEEERKRQEEERKRQEEERIAALINDSGNRAIYKRYAYDQFDDYGWSDSDFQCLVKLWNRESGWSPNAHNRSSGAHGIPQSLPASKMASFGSDYMTNYQTQIDWGLYYIKNRYGTPTKAWNHSQKYNWY